MMYLTQSLPGSSGRLKSVPEDFRVEEIPQFDCTGDGTWLHLLIRKRDLSTFEVVERLASALNLRKGDIGYAGIKDKRAVTVQWMSVPRWVEPRLESLELCDVEILDQRPHRHRLRAGDLAGNRFDIVIRETVPEALDRARAILAVLSRRGVPNLFGPQRFGTRENSDLLGRALLKGDWDEVLRQLLGSPSPLERDPRVLAARRLFDEGRTEQAESTFPAEFRVERAVLRRLTETADARLAVTRIPRPLRFLFVSAFQSRVFNDCLAKRLDTLDDVIDGDVLFDHRFESCFSVQEAESERSDVHAFRRSAAGPVFGKGMMRARGAAEALEARVFEQRDVDPASPGNPEAGVSLRGERRSYRARLEDCQVDAAQEGLRLKFELRRGSYATAVLKEIMKSPDALADESPPE